MYQVSCFYHKMHNWSDFLHESALLLGISFGLVLVTQETLVGVKCKMLQVAHEICLQISKDGLLNQASI